MAIQINNIKKDYINIKIKNETYIKMQITALLF